MLTHWLSRRCLRIGSIEGAYALVQLKVFTHWLNKSGGCESNKFSRCGSNKSGDAVCLPFILILFHRQEQCLAQNSIVDADAAHAVKDKDQCKINPWVGPGPKSNVF